MPLNVNVITTKVTQFTINMEVRRHSEDYSYQHPRQKSSFMFTLLMRHLQHLFFHHPHSTGSPQRKSSQAWTCNDACRLTDLHPKILIPRSPMLAYCSR